MGNFPILRLYNSIYIYFIIIGLEECRVCHLNEFHIQLYRYKRPIVFVYYKMKKDFSMTAGIDVFTKHSHITKRKYIKYFSFSQKYFPSVLE